MFFPNLIVKEMQMVLEPFIDIQMDEEPTSLRALEELPAAVESSIRELLNDQNEKPTIVEAYIHRDRTTNCC
ncbi:hypothetical protein EI200_19320 [Peribacillus simplex]|uniref:hypothetical protein n=1 Tax=Peribacillus simplex TaxID=1478 RepID=UPI000F635903|nr:hypothetical protein [Peribacillus simplex]RRN68485.1 hypothetical protein EI200_19320 [Peribacillus simplex]